MRDQIGNGHANYGAFSLLDGWLPITFQLAVLVLLVLVVAAIGWPTGRIRLRLLAVCVAVGVVAVLVAQAAFGRSGVASDPAPPQLWLWFGVSAGAVALAVGGWSRSTWWRRTSSVLLVPLCVLSTSVVVNQWLGYVTSVPQAWRHLTSAPVAHQVDAADLPALRGQVAPTEPGRVVKVSIPASASGFRHRDEYVYLPPAWFAGPTPPALPTLMLIGGEFGTPVDWITTGDAQSVVDAYARSHHGVAPILVLVDAGGSFVTDTECVDGVRGNAASHLTKDVPPYVVDHFGASADPRRWAVAGWSMGGTCALTLAVTHPERFGTFYDISGDPGPMTGNKEQTVERLYGGDVAAWTRDDPASVLAGHSPYTDTVGWIDTPDGSGQFVDDPPSSAERQAMADLIEKDRHLCELATSVRINCRLQIRPGQHDWTSGAVAFADALPRVADRILAEGADASVGAGGSPH